MNKLIFLFVLLFLFSINLSSSLEFIGTYKINTDLNLYLGCSNNNTYCPSSYTCNISIYSPNSSLLINNKLMSNTSYPQYNYTLNSSILNTFGEYTGRQLCCSSSSCADYGFYFKVNAQGKNYTTADSIIYLVLLPILLSLFIFLVYVTAKIEGDNKKNENQIIEINWYKYLKIFCFLMAYVTFIGIAYFCWNISYGILEFTELANFFQVIFRISFIAMFPLFVMIIIYSVVKFINDFDAYKYLQRGLDVYG